MGAQCVLDGGGGEVFFKDTRISNNWKPDQLHGLLCLNSNRPVHTLDEFDNGSLILSQVVTIPEGRGGKKLKKCDTSISSRALPQSEPVLLVCPKFE